MRAATGSRTGDAVNGPGRPPVAGSQFGRYRIESRIGMGGMGVVYSALDQRLGRVVALKVLSGQLAGDAEFVERFQREADVLARLDSPHVIAIFDHGEQDGVPFIATQYVAGGDLGRLLERRGPMDVATAASVCAQVADALSDAHRAGVVHRDVKAGNVLVRDPDAGELHVYLGDFGIAQTESRGLTRAGGVAGSWEYLAPERAHGEPASPASDCYAVGCLLWACVTGHPPYGGSDVEVALAHVNAPVPRLEGDDPRTVRFNEVVSRAMAKSPADRHPTAADLRADLRALAAVEGAGEPAQRVVVAAPPAAYSGTGGSGTVVRPTSRPRRRRRALLVGAAALALAVGGSAAVALRDDPAPGESNAPRTPVSGTSGDVDGDGLGDVVVRRYDWSGAKPARDYLLTSDGEQFAEPLALTSRPGAVSSGDVDGDGRQELVAFERIGRHDATIARTVHLDGQVDSTRFPGSDSRPSAAITLGDVDGDGDDDLILYGFAGEDEGADVEVALSGPDGFAEPTLWYRISSWAGFYDNIETGDFDLDGRADLVLAQRRSAGKARETLQLRILHAADGRFVSAPRSRTIELDGAPQWVMAGNVDGDDTAEIVGYFPDDPGHRVAVFDVDDDGTIGRGERWGQDEVPEVRGSAGMWPLLSDVDGDGLDDVAILRPPVDRALALDVMLSDGSAFAPPQTWASIPCLKRDCDESDNPVTGAD